MTVIVSPEGQVRFVHDDDAVDTFECMGRTSARRASTVEPHHSPLWGLMWKADLGPVGGPVARFTSRASALAWEREWLEEHDVPEPRA